MLTNTALLFFTRSATAEAANKTIVGTNKKLNTKAASLLINHTRRTALATGLPVYEVNEQQQVGTEFGDRLANAMEVVFADGFEKVVVIGNDCPQLTTGILNRAVAELQNAPLVLGPDTRGGVYLIGIDRNIFSRKRIICNSWQSSHLFKDLKENFREALVYDLPRLNDINELEDFFAIKDLLDTLSTIKAFIASLLASANKSYSYFPASYFNLQIFSFGLRAPPSVAD